MGMFEGTKKDPGLLHVTRAESKRTLHFDIRYYSTYEVYDWIPVYDQKLGYGEIKSEGQVNGDRAATDPMQHGCVYILKDKKVQQAYVVTQGMYQPVDVSPSDLSHRKKVGSARPYMQIADFFPARDSDFSEKYTVVVSDIKLSKQRLFESGCALTETRDPRATNISISRDRLRETEKENRSGPQIFADWQKWGDLRSHVSQIVTSFYDFRRDHFEGVEGFHLLTPNVAKEARRRNELYRTRLVTFQKWLNDDSRSEEVFLAQAVNSIIQQDPKYSKYVNKKLLEDWEDKDREDSRRHVWPVTYAIDNLVQWLEHPYFKSVLRDYSCGSDDEQKAGAELYGDAIRETHYAYPGADYLKREYDDKLSYFNQSTRLLALKRGYADPAAGQNVFFEFRKLSNEFFAFFEEFVAAIVAREGERARDLFIEFVHKRTGTKFLTVRVKPVERLEKYVSIVDIDHALAKIAHWPEAKSGRGIITCIEGFNVAFAFKGLIESEPGQDRAKSGVNLAGAILDFMSSNWLVKGAVDKLAKTAGFRGVLASNSIGVMIIVSGLIDAMLGVWEMKRAHERGDYDVMIGWGMFMLGGAIIAVGELLIVAAGDVTVGSGGGLAEVGALFLVGGLIVEGLGLLLVWKFSNNEIEDWLTQSRFGKLPSGKSNKDQLQALNNILCKFEVEAGFEELPGKLHDITLVTLKIKPRVITRRSRITLTQVQGIGRARLAEMINPLSTSNDIRGANLGYGDEVFDLDKLDPAAISEKDGRITEVRLALRSFEWDIDEVRGRAKLDLNNGTLQGYSTDFVVGV